MATPQRILATSAIVAVGVGTANSFIRYHRPPSTRFLVGSGIAFLTLSALAEAEPELAQSFGMAIASTVVLGEGSGLFSYVNKWGEADTHRGATDPKGGPLGRAREREDDPQGAMSTMDAPEAYAALFTPSLPAMPGIPPS